MSAPQPLRVGVLLDSFTVPAWIFSILDEIQQSDDARIELVIVNAAAPARRTMGQRLRNLRHLLLSLYIRADTRLFGQRAKHDAFAPMDARPLLQAIPTRRVNPLQKRWTDRFAAEDVQAVRDARLDVILRFGFRILRGEVLDTARYGVWSFHHGDNRRYRGGPALFWEMVERNPLSGTVLQILNEQLDAGRILYRSTAATDFNSWFRNRNATYWKTARFVGRRLRDLRRTGLNELIEAGPAVSGPIYRTPGNLKMVRFLAQTAWSNLRTQFENRFLRHQWFVAFAPRPGRLVGAAPRFAVIEPPPDRFYADPFVAESGGRTYVLLEDYSFRTGKGVISCIELRDGTPLPPRTVLERDYHLSYPALFPWQGQWFMTPETADNRTVELYRAVDFPWRWELDRVLLHDVNAADPTLFHHRERLWLFATVAPHGGSTHDELSLFSAETLDGPWLPHPRNPVVSDVQSARPAGSLFVEEGVIYRPGQNSARTYGHSISLNRVDTLTTTDYRETPIRRIEPSWLPSSVCTHTFNASEGWLVTDGKRLRFGTRGIVASRLIR